MPIDLAEALKEAKPAPRPIPADSGAETTPAAPAAPASSGGGIDLQAFFDAQPKPPTRLERVEGAARAAGGRVLQAIEDARVGAKVAIARGQAPKDPGTLQAAVSGFKGAVEQFKADLKDPDAAAEPLHGLKTAVDGIGIAFAPFVEGGRALLQDQVDKVGEKLAEAASPEEAKKKGIDWKLHREEVAKEVDALHKTVDTAYDAAMWVMPVPKLGKAAVDEARLAAGARMSLRDLAEAVKPPEFKVEPELKPVSMALDKSMGFQKASEIAGEQLSKIQPGAKMTHGAVMDMVLPHTEGYAKGFLEKLSQHIDRDAPVVFRKALDDPKHVGAHDVVNNTIEMKTGQGDMIQTFVHEAVHSVTTAMLNRLIGVELDAKKMELGRPLMNREVMEVINNPQGAMLKELDQIIDEARIRAQKAGREGELYGQQAYGLKAYGPAKKGAEIGMRAFHSMGYRYEFMAELFSSPRFQEFLANSEKYASKGYKFKNMLNQLGLWIGKHLGIKNPHELQLLNQAMRVGSQLMTLHSKEKPAAEWIGQTIVGRDAEGTITDGQVSQALKTGRLVDAEKASAAKKGLALTIEKLIRNLSPEALGERAKLAGAVIASRLQELEQKTAEVRYGSRTRSRYWRARPDKVIEFIDKFERGEKFTDPQLRKFADRYTEWAERLQKEDLRRGFEYEPESHYFPHIWQDEEGVANWMQKKFGDKWKQPGFTKDRVFNLVKEGIDAGFTLKYNNPEDIMLARDHASQVAGMREGILNDLASYGLAVRKIEAKETFTLEPDAEGKMQMVMKKIEGTRQPPDSTPVTSPTGDTFWVDNQAHQVLHNALFSKTLWTEPALHGMGFRGMMAVKNALVPVRLAVSLFHPLHVVGIDMATGMTRASAEMLSGRINPVVWMGKMLASGMNPLLETSKVFGKGGGWRVVDAWKGKIPKEMLTEEDATALKYLNEMGISPEMSEVYRTNARKNFTFALQDAMANFRQMKVGGAAGDLARATWHLPWATLSALQKPIFESWIPALKAASAIKDAKSLLLRSPELVENDAARLMAMRRIGKSVDNRYGEMAYNKLFWNRWVKDLAVLDTLSLGWQLGFIREYGGGALDLGQWAARGDKLQQIRMGKLDKALFVSNYTMVGGAVAGLMTWAMTGEAPHGMDFINPRTGEKNPDGTDQRVTTMFYSREFASVYKHMQNEGVVSGIKDAVLNKGSGMFSLMHDFATGVDSFGRHIWDENDPLQRKAEEMLSYSLAQLAPISLRSLNADGVREMGERLGTQKGALSALGFTPQPKYMTETKTEAAIIDSYRRFATSRETPYYRAERSKDLTKLREAYQSGSDKYPEMMDQMISKYEMTGKDIRQLVRSLNSTVPPTVRMFTELGRDIPTQKALLDKMTPEEREIYLPHANRKLRYSYVPPEEGQ